MKPGSDRWRGMITASRFAGACGVHPYTSRRKTWLNSLGIDRPSSEEPAIKWGVEHEPVAINLFEKVTQLSVQRHIPTIHNGIYGATPDGFINDDAGLEIKCPYSSHELPETIPLFHMCQIQGNMWVTNRPIWYYAVWVLMDEDEARRIWWVEKSQPFIAIMHKFLKEYSEWHGDPVAEVPNFKRGEKAARIAVLSSQRYSVVPKHIDCS